MSIEDYEKELWAKYELANATKESFQERWQELQSLENNRLAEQESLRKEKAGKAVDELLIFSETCVVSDDERPWHQFEKEEMVKIILKYL